MQMGMLQVELGRRLADVGAPRPASPLATASGPLLDPYAFEALPSQPLLPNRPRPASAACVQRAQCHSPLHHSPHRPPPSPSASAAWTGTQIPRTPGPWTAMGIHYGQSRPPPRSEGAIPSQAESSGLDLSGAVPSAPSHGHVAWEGGSLEETRSELTKCVDELHMVHRELAVISTQRDRAVARLEKTQRRRVRPPPSLESRPGWRPTKAADPARVGPPEALYHEPLQPHRPRHPGSAASSPRAAALQSQPMLLKTARRKPHR